jgi:transcriptional regulator
MYLPERFRGKGWRKLVRDHPLATLMSGSWISHLPLLLEKRSSGLFLLGHMARANDHWRALERKECLAIFHGPQAYVSPLWYGECDVPTWNYLVAHLRGRASILSEREAVRVLRKLSRRMEGQEGWRFQIPADLTTSLHQAIVAFEIEVTGVESKFKLSQNRSEEDRRGVIRGLKRRGAAEDLAVAGWMDEFMPRKKRRRSRKRS